MHAITLTHSCTFVCSHTHTHTQSHILTHSKITRMHHTITHIYTFTHIHTTTCSQSHTLTQSHTHTQAPIDTYTHAHTLIRSLFSPPQTFPFRGQEASQALNPGSASLLPDSGASSLTEKQWPKMLLQDLYSRPVKRTGKGRGSPRWCPSGLGHPPPPLSHRTERQVRILWREPPSPMAFPSQRH